MAWPFMPRSLTDFVLVRAVERASRRQRIFYALLGLGTYLALASSLRFRRRNKMQKAYPYQTREAMAKMTDDDAWAIQKQMLQMEFPFIILKSLQFALFRTYGIPTISNLLLKTSQLSDSTTSFKRYADTGTLIGEFMAFDPRSDRAQTAIARTNYLHQGYRSSAEPIRFVKLYEWREMGEMEKCAVGTYWKSLGDGMGISYDALPSGQKGFRDGIHWLEELSAWSEQYEAEHMKPHVRNKEIADKTIDVLVYSLPTFMKPLGVYFVSYFMDDRLRKAMMIEPAPPALRAIFASIFKMRQLYLRYLALPRTELGRLAVFTPDPDEHGRNFLQKFEGAPFYVRPTIWNRWGPTAWVKWTLGQPLPGDGGDKYSPQGYYTPDLGPKYFEGKGRKELETIKARLRDQRRGQCPFP